MHDVCIDWAEALQSYTLGAINYGIETAKGAPHPPNQGEFVNYCKAYKPPLTELRLERTWSAEEINTNQRRMAGIVAMLKGNERVKRECGL